MKNVIITSAVRTAVGSLGKSLKNISGAELGSAVISNTINCIIILHMCMADT